MMKAVARNRDRSGPTATSCFTWSCFWPRPPTAAPHLMLYGETHGKPRSTGPGNVLYVFYLPPQVGPEDLDGQSGPADRGAALF